MKSSVKVIRPGATGQMIAAACVVGVSVGTAVGTVVGRLNRRELQESKESAHKGPVNAFDREAVGIKKDARGGKKDKLVGFAERKNWRWLGRTLQIQTRYSELGGSNIAASVTLQVFLSLFPLLLVATAVIGFIVNGDSNAASRIISGMGLTGDAAQAMNDALATAQENRKASSIVGLATLAWSAIGVSTALQYAFNQAWQTSDRGLKDKAIGAGWLAGAAIFFVATVAVSTCVNWLPAELSVVGVGVGLLLSFALWAFTAKILPNVNVSWRSVVPGAILGTVGLEILKFLGAVWIPKAAASSSELYGSVGIVLAVLAFVLLFGKLVMYSAVTNVVFHEARHGTAEAAIQMPRPAAAGADGVKRSGRADS